LASLGFCLRLVGIFLEHYKRNIYRSEEGKVWTKQSLRIVSYAQPLFYIWLGVMTHRTVWWLSGFITLDHRCIVLGWIQSCFVILCTLVSFLGPIAHG
jgi:hypothetical protein